MVWSPIEVILILAIWFPLGLGLVFTPYIMTIFSVMILGSGSFAAVQAGRGTAQAWFGFLCALFITVLILGVLFVALGPPTIQSIIP